MSRGVRAKNDTKVQRGDAIGVLNVTNHLSLSFMEFMHETLNNNLISNIIMVLNILRMSI